MGRHIVAFVGEYPPDKIQLFSLVCRWLAWISSPLTPFGRPDTQVLPFHCVFGATLAFFRSRKIVLLTPRLQNSSWRYILHVRAGLNQRLVFRFFLVSKTSGAIHSTKLSGNFGPKLNGSVRSNRKSFGKTGPPFEVVLFSRSDRLEFWLNGSRLSFTALFISHAKSEVQNPTDICVFRCRQSS